MEAWRERDFCTFAPLRGRMRGICGLPMSSPTPIDNETLRRFRSDMEEVRASLSDDPEAQKQLLDRLKCVPRILAAKNAQIGSPFDSAELEDLAQETVLKVWDKRSEFAGRATLESWVFPFCYYALMNRVRKLRRQPKTVDVDAAASVEAKQAQDYTHVHRAIAQLPDEEGVVVRARYFERLSFPEIGTLLEITTSTVKHRYYRGMDRLRLLLAPSEEEGKRG